MIKLNFLSLRCAQTAKKKLHLRGLVHTESLRRLLVICYGLAECDENLRINSRRGRVNVLILNNVLVARENGV